MAVAVRGKQRPRRAVDTGLAHATAAVELQPHHGDSVQAKADGALGESGDHVELQPLPPLLGLAGVGGITHLALAFPVVRIEIEIAQVQRGLAVIDKTGGDGLVGQATQGDGQGQGLQLHCVYSGAGLLFFWCPGSGFA
ncbi:hypothetical protein D3C81_1136080 [compost metagenome]